MSQKPQRPGDVVAGSGNGSTINLDQRSRDALAWLKQAAKRTLKEDAGNSVLVRRALAVYVRHLEKLMALPESEAARMKRMAEAHSLRHAARGEARALPEEQLIAVPVVQFSSIVKAVSDAASEKQRAAILAPFTPE